MNCPHGQSHNPRKLALATDLGYARFQCRSCRRTFNERTGTPFNFLEMPTDIVFQVVLFRLLFKLSLRDLRHLFLIRGYEFSDETVRDWEARFAPLLADHARRRRRWDAVGLWMRGSLKRGDSLPWQMNPSRTAYDTDLTEAEWEQLDLSELGFGLLQGVRQRTAG